MTDERPERVKILFEAAELIDGDRNISYGTPTQNFTNIAEMWTTRFRHMLKDGESFSAADIADAMILLKVARNIAVMKRDNFLDIAGYAGCAWEAVESQKPVLGVTTPNPPDNILLRDDATAPLSAAESEEPTSGPTFNIPLADGKISKSWPTPDPLEMKSKKRRRRIIRGR